MKTYYFNQLLINLLLFTLFLIPLYAQDSSLVGFWTFDDSTGVDSSLYGNNGTLNGNPMLISGMKGSAMYFDGIDDEVFVWDSNSLDTDSSMTIALWIMPDSVNPGGAKAMCKWYSAPEEGDWILSLSSQDSCGGDCVSYHFGFANYGVYGYPEGWFAIYPHNVDYFLILGQWNFIAVTFDTGFVNLYYNGELIYTDTTIIKYTSLNEYSSDNIHIGRYHTGNPNYSFKGGLDEIRIYNRPLSASEINDLYNQVTSIENPAYKDEFPAEFDLFQNYPNPFNPTTRIKYQIPEMSSVILKVFDVLGNEITTLINEEKPVGTYEVEFNCHSGSVRNLPSGVYFYQLKAG
ncbi:MAG: T9SS type A sorting domain-containing protein, partial [Ignavibacteriaceae bacterium]|nr:T9SS type A sorting domain-containing protein [Ignavibacteriaceae bacterium]